MFDNFVLFTFPITKRYQTVLFILTRKKTSNVEERLDSSRVKLFEKDLRARVPQRFPQTFVERHVGRLTGETVVDVDAGRSPHLRRDRREDRRTCGLLQRLGKRPDDGEHEPVKPPVAI